MEKLPVARLVQRFRGFRIQELELTEEELRMRAKTPTSDSRRSIPLEVFDRNDTEARAFPSWTLPSAAIGAAVGILGLLWGARIAGIVGTVSGAFGFGAAAIGFGVSLALLGLHFALSSDTLIFYNTFTGEFLLAIPRDRPDGESVTAFASKLKEMAKRRYEQLRADAERPSIAKELLALDDLRGKKIINDEEFATKKDELLDDMMRE